MYGNDHSHRMPIRREQPRADENPAYSVDDPDRRYRPGVWLGATAAVIVGFWIVIAVFG